MERAKGIKVIAVNRKAAHDYHVLDKLEAGIMLAGSEVKSLREGRINLKGSHAGISQGEVFLYDCHISEYKQANRQNHDPTRTRKLLLKKGEIKRLLGKTKEQGLTLVPLRVYFTRNYAKVELGLCRGKKLYDKRHDLQERQHKRDMERAYKNRT
ncbi:MAG: SsrA-binding protein SmpB [bacterium]